MITAATTIQKLNTRKEKPFCCFFPGMISFPSFLFYISVFFFLPGEHHSVKYLFDLLTVNRIRILVF